MGSSPYGFNFPLGTTPANQLPLQLLDVQTLLANAPAFPREFFFPAFPDIIMLARVPGYGGSDVISLQFNGDTGANYWDNTITTAAVAASGTTAPANSEVATVARMEPECWRVGFNWNAVKAAATEYLD